MSAYYGMTLIGTDETITAENHPFYPNIKNRAGRQLAALLQVEHENDGRHLYEYGLQYEVGSYTGNGASSRTISLSKTHLVPSYVLIFGNYDTTFNPVMRYSSMPANGSTRRGKTLEHLTDAILSESEGAFTVGSNDFVNKISQPFQYLVFGGPTEIGTYANSGGTDPTWVVHGDSLVGGTVGTENANKVECHIYSKIRTAHTDLEQAIPGQHFTDPWVSNIVVGSYLGDGTADRTITLEFSSNRPMYGEIVNLGDGGLIDMTLRSFWYMSGTDNSKSDGVAAFEDAGFLAEFTTREIHVEGWCNGTNIPYYYMIMDNNDYFNRF